MNAKVVDASAIAAIMFDEAEAEQAARAIQGFELIAPELIMFELANIYLKKVRKHPERQSVFIAAFEQRGQFGIEARAVDHDAVLRVAHEHGLTAYDASYLWLSWHVGAPLVTFDKQLIRARAH